MTEDLKYRQKYKELGKRIRDIEEENDMLNIRLFKARKSIRHLKLERTFLLDRMERSSHPSIDDNSDNSDIGSEIYSHDETDVLLHRLQGNGSKHHGSNRIEKLIGSNTASKAQRKKKDPNAPKGPGNVFFLYCRFERDKMKDEHPAENLGEVTRLLGQKWKGLAKEEKTKYYDMYKRELGEYEEAMKSYTAAGGSASATAITATPAFTAATATAATATEDEVAAIEDIDEDATEDEEHLVSVASSPAQSTELSMDFPGDAMNHSPGGSMMDEDDKATGNSGLVNTMNT